MRSAFSSVTKACFYGHSWSAASTAVRILYGRPRVTEPDAQERVQCLEDVVKRTIVQIALMVWQKLHVPLSVPAMLPPVLYAAPEANDRNLVVSW